MVDCDNKVFITGSDRGKFEYYDITRTGELLGIEALMVTRSSVMTIIITTDFRVLEKSNCAVGNFTAFTEIPDLRAKYTYTCGYVALFINLEDELLVQSIFGWSVNRPQVIPGFKVMSVSCGNHHCVIVTTEHQVFGRGDSTSGQLGVSGYRSDFELIPDVLATYVSCGGYYTGIITPESHIMVSGFEPGMVVFTKIFDGHVTFLLCGPQYIIVGDASNDMYIRGRNCIGSIPAKFVSQFTLIPNFRGVSAFCDRLDNELYLVSEYGQMFKCSTEIGLEEVPGIICSDVPMDRFRNTKPAE